MIIPDYIIDLSLQVGWQNLLKFGYDLFFQMFKLATCIGEFFLLFLNLSFRHEISLNISLR